MFNQIGVRVKGGSPFAHTLVAGYGNGYIGYVPTVEEYARGGYEVDVAHRYYRPTAFSPAASDLLAETARWLLGELRATLAAGNPGAPRPG